MFYTAQMDIFSKIGKSKEEVAQWMSVHSPTLAIMTPCFDGVIAVNYHVCLTRTMSYMQQVGIKTKTFFLPGDSLVHRARNNLLAMAMADESVTHFLFIDGDIEWDAADVALLILRDRDLIGGIYPKKRLHLGRLTQSPETISNILNNKSPFLAHAPNDLYLESTLLDYNLNYLQGVPLTCTNMVAEVLEIATGFMMFRRSMVLRMMECFPQTKFTCNIGLLTPEQNAYAYCLFDSAVENGQLVSEDYLFCRRWKKIGGQVFADLSIPLAHIGKHTFRGAVISSLSLTPAVQQQTSGSSTESASAAFVVDSENNDQPDLIAKRRRVVYEE